LPHRTKRPSLRRSLIFERVAAFFLSEDPHSAVTDEERDSAYS